MTCSVASTRSRPHSHMRFPSVSPGHPWRSLALVLVLVTSGVAAAQDAPAASPADPSSPSTAVTELPTSVEDLRRMDALQRDLVRRLMAATVGIQIGATQGSGVIVSPDGFVLTAAHVAGEAGRRVFILTSRGERVPGRTLGLNNNFDAGLIKIEGSPVTGARTGENDTTPWPHAEMATSSDLRPGTWCLALGHPGGYQPDRQAVARLGRVLSVTGTVIETDCVLVGGDSGGPLFDLDGRVVGIHSRIGDQLIKNMHVPVRAYHDSWDRLVRGDVWGSLQKLMGRPIIGVLGDRHQDAPRIAQVLPASPAQSAGLQPGDLVLRFGHEEVKKFDDLTASVRRRTPGDEVVVVVARGEETLEFSIVIGALSVSADDPAARDGSGELLRSGGATTDRDTTAGHPRQHPSVRQVFRDVVRQSAKSTVRVFCHDQQVALGTIFDADGWIATKASELTGPASCELSDGTRYDAALISADRGSDLAVLRISARGLPAIEWRDEDPPAVGSWVVTPGPTDLPQAVGIVSVAPHPVRGGILGVQLAEDQPGPRVTFVVPQSAAASAGLATGDIITQIDERTVASADAVVATTSTLLPGDRIKLTIMRHNQVEQLEAVLGSVDETLSTNRARFQDRLGGPLSTRRVLFPLALEHDTVLQPRDCGGPLVDLEGRAVGINIARASRVASYAIPASVARPLLESLKTQPPLAVSHEAGPAELSITAAGR